MEIILIVRITGIIHLWENSCKILCEILPESDRNDIIKINERKPNCGKPDHWNKDKKTIELLHI